MITCPFSPPLSSHSFPPSFPPSHPPPHPSFMFAAFTPARAGRSRGFGFVTLSTREEAERAVKEADQAPPPPPPRMHTHRTHTVGWWWRGRRTASGVQAGPAPAVAAPADGECPPSAQARRACSRQADRPARSRRGACAGPSAFAHAACVCVCEVKGGPRRLPTVNVQTGGAGVTGRGAGTCPRGGVEQGTRAG